MTPGSITAALVGCGRIGTQTGDALRGRLPPGWLPLSHAEAIQSEPALTLVAVCDTDAERLALAADRYSVSRRYTDYRVLLEEVRPQVLSIATRTHGRAEIVSCAAERGVRAMHVEKPFARSLSECDAALRELRAHGVHVTYGTTRRYMNIYRRAQELIADGAIGEVEQILVEHGRTSLLWNHPHSADLLLFFAGPTQVESVEARCIVEGVSTDGMTVDDDPLIVNALVRFENGVSGVITAARGMNTRISGSKGTLTVLADGSAIEIRTNRSGQGPYLRDVDLVEGAATASGTRNCMTELAASTRGPLRPAISLEEIRAGLAILLGAVYSSLRSGRSVAPRDLPAGFTVSGRTGALYA